MQPTININVSDANAEGDTIYINKYARITNNDIAVAKVSWHEHYIIKRVVGTPGDKVEIRDLETVYGVYVNDSLLYAKEKYGENSAFIKTGSVGYFASYQDLLKNANFQNNVETDGTTSYIVLHENEYFLMGDNWGHTTDSVTKGVVKSSELVGKVDLIVDVTNNRPFTATWFFLKKIFS